MCQLYKGYLNKQTHEANIPNTAMILKTSTMPIDGLSGSKTKDGVKNIPIQRSDQSAYPVTSSASPAQNHN